MSNLETRRKILAALRKAEPEAVKAGVEVYAKHLRGIADVSTEDAQRVLESLTQNVFGKDDTLDALVTVKMFMGLLEYHGEA
jgi:hypothetical protein